MTWQENIAADFGWVHDWQTLIGALLATAAAIVTVVMMHQQNLEARQRDAEASQRRSLAARARMPNALRDLIDFCEEGADRLLSGNTTLPDEPIAALEDLKLAIEFIETQKAEQLFELLSHYQVYTSRFSGYDSFGRGQDLYDTAKLHHYTSRLFGYARNNDEEQPLSENHLMHNSLNTMVELRARVTNEDRFEEARQLIERRHPN